MFAELGESLMPRFLAAEWRGAGTTGRAAWPSGVLLVLHLLRWSEGGMSRLGACRRAKTDLAWRAAMGLPAGGLTPKEKTMREFEDWLMERSPSCDLPRYMVLHERIVHLVERGVPSERIWMEDSTPMLCFGALRGTVRLLGGGLRSLLRRWSRITKSSMVKQARDWGVPWVNARSIKGGLDIDWRDRDARHDVVHRLAQDVLRVVDEITNRLHQLPPQHQQDIQRRCGVLLKIITDDLETDAAGRLVIARRRTPDRIVSVTDPEARSGRKSSNQPYKGFKLSVLGDLVSGLITAVIVVAGNAGDAKPGHELLERAKRMGLRIERLLADSAYGGTADRLVVRSLGIELVAPPHAAPADNDEVVQKHEFEIDFEQHRATCPAGVETAVHRMVSHQGEQCSRYEWPYATCAACELREKCVPRMSVSPKHMGRPRKGRRLVLHAQEEELRAARAAWEDPALRQAYRKRGQGELLIARMVRYGARQVRAFGLAAANLQAHSVAIAANLALLARVLAARLSPAPLAPLPLFPDTS